MSENRAKTMKNIRRIAVFCGGRGSATLLKAIVSDPRLGVGALINGYDDGLSTGSIRRAFGMLGPSDVRKNHRTMIPPSLALLGEFIDFRFPVSIEHSQAIDCIRSLVASKADVFGLSECLDILDTASRRLISTHLASFLTHLGRYEAESGEPFLFEDCAIANCLYAGAFEIGGRNFTSMCAAIGSLFGSLGDVVPVSDEALHLVGVSTEGTILASEAELDNPPAETSILELATLRRSLTAEEIADARRLPLYGKLDYLRERAMTPPVTEICANTILNADIIIFGPGTPHTSLLPSYMVDPMGQMVRSARGCKVFVANIAEDAESHGATVGDLLEQTVTRLQQTDSQRFAPARYIDCVVVSRSPYDDSSLRRTRYMPHERSLFGLPILYEFLEHPERPGVHDGLRLLEVVLAWCSRHMRAI